ncbi:hypothetical protein GQ53DRAFT_163782 [Thozetella sp. PMI_491]|nr:hypothetical protein GQ53DRAFT_163782 [Thozetella sp. PMI_491]
MSATATTYSTTTRHTLSRRRGPGFGGITTASTPNLNQLYTAQATRLGPPSLARKGSIAALTPSSLAAIPDDTESYANSILTTDATKMPADDPVTIGDVVDVPGGMLGVVRFIGSVQGRKGTFAGVELQKEHASRGKNNGDVDGISYFTTSKPGAGIFLPLSKAARHSPTPSYPMTPTSTTPGGLKIANQNSTNFTPPTPSIPKFSQSVGPGRAASPSGKKAPRPSLPRPDSPVRRLQMTPAPRQSIATPGPKGPTRFGSPNATNKLAQSVRGTAGDPSKRLPARERKGSIGPRSASALGNTTSTPSGFTDDETTPVGPSRTKTNGSIGSVSSFGLKLRPGSRAQSRAGSRAGNHAANDEEVEKLRTQLEDRDRQLKDQAATLAEMESSLTELQGLIENSEGPPSGIVRRGSIEDKDTVQLRALLREKNEKIAMLTAEFDAHRADFRSTIDTLEMASTETERVYEKRIEELMQENQELSERSADVDSFASQLKQLEELVQELEEGLEDARRGEAEARGEVEFLRGEVERTRSELRREREKAQAAMGGNAGTNGNRVSMSKELEQKEDEIRGLKAIIHSLSRDSLPGDASDKISGQASRSKHESIEERLAREKLEREITDLRSVIDTKKHREEELEREIENLRRHSAATGPTSNAERSSMRDSRGTVVLSPRSPELHKAVPSLTHHSRVLDSMPESDSYSTATETSTLWCEICETGGHDILTCSNMFGSEAVQKEGGPAKTGRDVVREGLKNLTVPGAHEDIKPAPLSPIKTKAPTSVPDTVRILPNPMDAGPVAGKESGVVDAGKWCALCERDGHDSVDCPFEDAF